MTQKSRIIVRFKGLKKSRVAISILDFLSPLKQTIIRSFLVSLVFINGITCVWGFVNWLVVGGN
ncbi:MAG: hypothetical protein FE834_04085 [Gammaproteobacteria bacterium]|nr:hypothetical protein [Gammaproteobacteria bacterium]